MARGQPRLMNMPICAIVNATMMRAMFHMRNIPRRFCTMMECTNAVIASQGISAEFSTGSHAQYPPQPSMVYAHQLPSMSPIVRTSHDTMPHSLPKSTHSSRPPRLAASAPIAMLTALRPAPVPPFAAAGV